MIPKYEKLFDEEIKEFIRISETFVKESLSNSIEDMRQSYNEMVKHFKRARSPSVKVEDKKVAFKERSLIYRKYSTNLNNMADLIYFHGGGFVLGGLESHDDICAEICESTGCNVFSLDYSLAPEVRYPEFFLDAIRFYYFIKDPERRLILVGDSAGGTLAGFVSNKVRNVPIRPEAQVLIYPDLAGQTSGPNKRRFSDAPLLTQEDIDFYHKCAGLPLEKGLHDLIRNFDNDNMPKTLLVSAEIDPLVDDCQDYLESLKKNGCDITYLEGKGLPHGFLRARHLSKKARLVFDDIIKFIIHTK
jgi:acetyl esterase